MAKKPEKKIPTTIAAWRQQAAPTPVELPSGNTALLRRVSILELATSGAIPSTLIVKASEIKKGGKDWSSVLSDPEELGELMGMIKPVVIAAFVEPKVALVADDKHLGVDEIDPADQLAVFQYCNRGAVALRPFRRESQEGVEPAQPGEDVRDQAEPDSGSG